MVRAVLGLRDLSLDVPAAQTSLVALLQLMLQVSFDVCVGLFFVPLQLMLQVF